MNSKSQLQSLMTSKEGKVTWEGILDGLKEVSKPKGKNKENKNKGKNSNKSKKGQEEKNDKVEEIKDIRRKINNWKLISNLEDSHFFKDDIENQDEDIPKTKTSQHVICSVLKQNILAIGKNSNIIQFKNLSNNKISKLEESSDININEKDFETIKCMDLTDDSRFLVVGGKSKGSLFIRFYQSVVNESNIAQKFLHRGNFKINDQSQTFIGLMGKIIPSKKMKTLTTTALTFGNNLHSEKNPKEYLAVAYIDGIDSFIKIFEFNEKRRSPKKKKNSFKKKYFVKELNLIDKIRLDIEIMNLVYGHFIEEEHILLNSSGSDVIIWEKTKKEKDFKEKQKLKLHPGYKVISLSLNSEDLILVSGGNDDYIKIAVRKNKNSDFKIQQTFKGHEDTIRSVQFSQDSKMIISASNDSEVKIWRKNRLKPKLEFQGYISLKKHEGCVVSAKFGGNSKYAVSIGKNDKVSYFKLEEQLNYQYQQKIEVFLQSKEYKLKINYVDFLRNGQYLVTSTASIKPEKEDEEHDYSVKVWKFDKVNFEFVVDKELKRHKKKINCVKVRKYDNTLVVFSCSDDGTIRTWHDESGKGASLSDEKKMKFKMKVPSPVNLIDVNQSDMEGLYMISCYQNKKIMIWRHEEKYKFEAIKVIKDAFTEELNSEAFSVAISEDGKFAFSGHKNSKILFWHKEGNDEYEKSKYVLNHNTGKINSLSYDHNNKTLLSGGKDKILRLWEYKEKNDKSFEQIQFFEDAEDDIIKVSFENEGKMLFAATQSTLRAYVKIESGNYFRFLYKINSSPCFGVNKRASIIVHGDNELDNIVVVSRVKPQTNLMDSCLLYETILNIFDTSHGNLNKKGN